MVEYPQVLKNVKVARSNDLGGAKAVWEAVADVEAELGREGRVLVRASGTEPVVRVMVEAASQEQAGGYADRLAEAVMAELGER
jgi:phosphoglucosamine mutase